MALLKMTDLNLTGKRVLLREDFNVPLQDGHIMDDSRIRAALPAIHMALQQQAKVILVSHLGRPKEGQEDKALSLAPVAKRLEELLNHPVHFAKDWLDGVAMAAGEVVLCENVRFQPGEKANAPELARRIAALADVFVMDAFATAHRAEASTYGVAEFAPIACAGPLLIAELQALQRVLQQPVQPLLAIVGGAKVSTKLSILESLLAKVDQLIVGGGIANTFLAAAGYTVGKSLYEPELIPQAQRLSELAKQHGVDILLPTDVITAKAFSATATAEIKAVTAVADDDMILDIGPKTAATFSERLQTVKTILWNGPVGAFELPPFSKGTQALAEAIARSPAFSVAGGGDTLAAINQYHISEHLSYISTGGGAFLEFMEGKLLPAVAILEQRGSQ